MDKLVNIPALPFFSNGITKFRTASAILVYALIASRIALGKSGAIFQGVVCRWSSNRSSIRVKELPRKLSRVKETATVLKPTQVCKSRRLRCTRESSLRNSAKNRP